MSLLVCLLADNFFKQGKENEKSFFSCRGSFIC